MIYSPTGYTILKLQSAEEPSGFIYKVMGSWDGSYLEGESWRVNSGIESIDDKGDYLHLNGFSGSTYVVRKEGRGLNTFAMGVLQGFLQDTEVVVEIITTEELLEAFNES